MPPQQIHVGHFAMGDERPEYVELKPQRVPSADGCDDRDEMCESWAAGGECECRARGGLLLKQEGGGVFFPAIQSVRPIEHGSNTRLRLCS